MDLFAVFSVIMSTALLISLIFLIMGGPFLVAGGYLGHTIGQLIGRALGFVSSLAP